MADVTAWAAAQFGGVDLGDTRRTSRLVRIAASAARLPAGTVSGVFEEDADRQGAYDFLESEHVSAAALETGVGQKAAAMCSCERRLFVAVDGSSLTFVDHTGERGLGAIGSYASGARGMKVISALAVTDTGVPLALLRQVAWRRPAERPTNRRPARKRPIDKKETRHWVDAITTSAERIATNAPGTKLTYLIDREGDSAAILASLAKTAQDFIVRGNWDREVVADDGRRWKVRNLLAYQRPIGSYEVDLVGRPGRTARTAHVELACAEVELSFKDPTCGSTLTLKLAAVRAREIGTAPKGDDPLDWLLLTTLPAANEKQARAIVAGYTLRWRIEEFHRTWKSGRCHVEDSQLRSFEALQKWALVLATVAVRLERIKRRSRAEPNAPASVEFSDAELHALILLKRRNGRTIPDGVPTLQQATLWLAELGGYTGKSSGGPPGAITLARGLDKVRAAAAALEELVRAAEK